MAFVACLRYFDLRFGAALLPFFRQFLLVSIAVSLCRLGQLIGITIDSALKVWIWFSVSLIVSRVSVVFV